MQSRTLASSGVCSLICPSTLSAMPSAYRLFHSNPAHPGLHFKKLEGEADICSVRIGLDYRALAVMKKDRIVWYWIGSHSEYDRLA